MDGIRIVIADDHAVVRAGLRLLLDAEDGFRVVAEAGEIDTTRRMVGAHRPDVLVLDLNMPGGASLPAIPQLAEPRRAVVVLTMQNDPAFAREALQAGARGYVLKEAADSELVQAVRAAADGRSYLNPELGGRIGRGAAGAGRTAGRPDGARARDPPPDRARPHQRRDRQAALSQRAHRRVAPRAHPAEDPSQHARRARGLRARARADRLTARASTDPSCGERPMAPPAITEHCRAMNKLYRYGGVVASVILIAIGVGCIYMGVDGRNRVQNDLAREKIVGTEDSTIPGQTVDTGAEAQAFANVMRKHTLEATEGQTYSEMGRFLDESGKPTSDEAAAAKDAKTGQPVENPARNIWISSTAFQTALNTAYFAESVATFVLVDRHRAAARGRRAARPGPGAARAPGPWR